MSEVIVTLVAFIIILLIIKDMGQAVHGQGGGPNGIGMWLWVWWRMRGVVPIAGAGGSCIRGGMPGAGACRSRVSGKVVRVVVHGVRVGGFVAGALLVPFLISLQVLPNAQLHNDRADLPTFSTCLKFAREPCAVNVISTYVPYAGTHSATALTGFTVWSVAYDTTAINK
jgi:hypothetical protein